MPGPMSCPDRRDPSLVTNGEKREKLRAKGQLRTGKTARKNGAAS